MAARSLRTSLAFDRGKVKVFDTPAVERTAIDAAAGAFAFPRLAFHVRSG